MASELRVTTIANNAGSESVDTTYVVNGSAKLVVRYTTVTTTATVGSPLNASSLTDNGTGDTSISITSSFNDALYGALATGTNNKSSSGVSTFGPYATSWTGSSSALTTSSARISQKFVSSSTSTDTDVDVTTVALIGDLA